MALPWKEGIVRLEVDKDTFVSLGREENTMEGQNKNGRARSTGRKKEKKKEKRNTDIFYISSLSVLVGIAVEFFLRKFILL